MHIHIIEHEPIEFSKNLLHYIHNNNHTVSVTNACTNEFKSIPHDFDCLIIAGGSQHVYEEDKYPWLVMEKQFIARAVEDQKYIFGICLGAQLLAEALGGKVFFNEFEELGWYDVSLTPAGLASFVFDMIPERFTIFQWHSDHYTLPPGAVRLASSAAAENQAFISANGRVVGIQFHPDFDCGSIQHMVRTTMDKWPSGPYVTKQNELIQKTGRMREPAWLMNQMLDNFTAKMEPRR